MRHLFYFFCGLIFFFLIAPTPFLRSRFVAIFFILFYCFFLNWRVHLLASVRRAVGIVEVIARQRVRHLQRQRVLRDIDALHQHNRVIAGRRGPCYRSRIGTAGEVVRPGHRAGCFRQQEAQRDPVRHGRKHTQCVPIL